MLTQTFPRNFSAGKLDLEDELNTSLTKAHAIATLALDENFRNYPDSIRHGCLWAISDYIEASISATDSLQSSKHT